jgi:hypothetical protein
LGKKHLIECLPEVEVQADSFFLTPGRTLPFSSAHQDSILPYNMASLKRGSYSGKNGGICGFF